MCFSVILFFQMNRSEPPTQQDPETCDSVVDVIQMLMKNVVEETSTIPIRRGHVLEDALRTVKRKNFKATHRVTVSL